MIIFGKQLVFHVLQKHPEQIKIIYLAKEVEKSAFNAIRKSGKKIEKLDFKKAQALAKGGNHQGFLALVEDFELAKFSDLKSFNRLVMLYGISDVGNIGSIVRSAYALGGDGLIIVAKNLAIDGITRTSCGAAYELPIVLVDDGLSALNELKQSGFKIYAADANGSEICEKSEKFVLVMGSEGDGIPKKALEKCDKIVGIKMRDDWDSLNVSVAFGILFDRMING